MSIYTNRKGITIMASTLLHYQLKGSFSLIEFLLVIVGIPLAVMAVMCHTTAYRNTRHRIAF